MLLFAAVSARRSSSGSPRTQCTCGFGMGLCVRVAAFAIVVIAMRTLPHALLAQLLAALPAQSISPLRTGCGARGTVLDGYGAPVPGQTIEFHLRDAAPNAVHVLVLGSSSSSWSGTPLPLA